MVFAEVKDLEARWRELSPDEKERAALLLEDASVYLYSLVDKVNYDVMKIVVCNMVQRSMSASDTDAYGVSQQSMTAGPYTQSWTYSNPSGDFYLTKLEKRMLGITSGYIGSLRPEIGCHDKRRGNNCKATECC